MVVMNSRVGHCWGCGGVGYHIAECPRRSLLVPGADGSFSRGPFEGRLKLGGGNMVGAPGGKEGPLWGGSILGYGNRSHSPMGGASLGAR